jgi:hypothetical protein
MIPNKLDLIKGAAKYATAKVLTYGQELNDVQKKRIHICQTSGANGGKCQNFDEQHRGKHGIEPRCCNPVIWDDCPNDTRGCGCYIIEKSWYEDTEHCPLGLW